MTTSKKFVDAERRSENQSARVYVRMSSSEREALRLIAKARGITVADVMREVLAPVISSEVKSA